MHLLPSEIEVGWQHGHAGSFLCMTDRWEAKYIYEWQKRRADSGHCAVSSVVRQLALDLCVLDIVRTLVGHVNHRPQHIAGCRIEDVVATVAWVHAIGE